MRKLKWVMDQYAWAVQGKAIQMRYTLEARPCSRGDTEWTLRFEAQGDRFNNTLWSRRYSSQEAALLEAQEHWGAIQKDLKEWL